MANQLSLTVGQATISVPIRGTAAQIRAAITRYAMRRDLAIVDLTDAQIAEAVLRALLRDVRDGSIEIQRAMQIEAQRAAIEATVTADNDLVDETIP